MLAILKNFSTTGEFNIRSRKFKTMTIVRHIAWNVKDLDIAIIGGLWRMKYKENEATCFNNFVIKRDKIIISSGFSHARIPYLCRKLSPVIVTSPVIPLGR